MNSDRPVGYTHKISYMKQDHILGCKVPAFFRTLEELIDHYVGILQKNPEISDIKVEKI